jgi:hypothetical protein
VGLTPLFPVLARTQGAYTTNFFRTESPISEAGHWVYGVAGRLNPRSHGFRLSRGFARIWMADRSFAKTGDVFKATMSATTISARAAVLGLPFL